MTEIPPRYAHTQLEPDARTEIEAAVLRRLLAHLDARKDVQNIDLMNLSGFCRNCLSRWYSEEAEARGQPLGKVEAREIVYGMPYEAWRDQHQSEASPEARAAFAQGQRSGGHES